MLTGSCTKACAILSSGTASPFSRNPSTSGLNIPNSCTCQCNVEVPVFREDLHICVNDIHGTYLFIICISSRIIVLGRSKSFSKESFKF